MLRVLSCALLTDKVKLFLEVEMKREREGEREREREGERERERERERCLWKSKCESEFLEDESI